MSSAHPPKVLAQDAHDLYDQQFLAPTADPQPDAAARGAARSLWRARCGEDGGGAGADLGQFWDLPPEQQWQVITQLQPYASQEKVRAFLHEVERAKRVRKDVRDIAGEVRSSAPPKAEKDGRQAKLVEWFTGTVNRIDKDENLAYAVLFDANRREYVAQFEPKKVRKAGLREGDPFVCVVANDGEKVTVTLLPRPPEELSEQEKQAIHRMVDEAFAPFEASHDDGPPDRERRRG